MPNILQRQRVQRPRIGTAPSGGAVIGQGLAQIGAGIAGQVGEQRFQMEQLEIKQQERRAVMEAQTAVINKNSARVLATQQIRSENNPEDYIAKLTEWEDKFNEEATREQSQAFTESFNQRDFINRVNGAKSMGTSMNRDILEGEKFSFISNLRTSVASGDLSSFESAIDTAREGGVLSDAFMEEARLTYGKQLAEGFIFTAPEDIVMQELEDPNSVLTQNFSQQQIEGYKDDVRKRQVDSLNLRETEFTLSLSEDINGLYDLGYIQNQPRAQLMEFVNSVSEPGTAKFDKLSEIVNGMVKKAPTGSTTATQKANRDLYEDELSEITELFNQNTGGEVDRSSLSAISNFSKQLSDLQERMFVDVNDGNLSTGDINAVRTDINLARIRLLGALNNDNDAHLKTVAGQGMDILSITGAVPGRTGLSVEQSAFYRNKFLEAIANNLENLDTLDNESQSRAEANKISDSVLTQMAISNGVQGEKNIEAFKESATSTPSGGKAIKSVTQDAVNEVATSQQEAFELSKRAGHTDEVAREIANDWEILNTPATEFAEPAQPSLSNELLREIVQGLPPGATVEKQRERQEASDILQKIVTAPSASVTQGQLSGSEDFNRLLELVDESFVGDFIFGLLNAGQAREDIGL